MSDAATPGRSIPSEDLEDLYQNAPCGYLSMDAGGRICKVNTTLLSWLAMEPQQLVGRRMHELLNMAGRIYYETHFAPLLRMQGFFHEVALDLVTASGEALAVIANAAERRDDHGNVMFTRLTIFKATDRRRYERELLEARSAAIKARAELDVVNAELAQKLELSQTSEATIRNILEVERETAELREQFIAVLGHDLRNPLTAILSGLYILQREPLSERASSMVAMMQRSGQRIAGLIENVLDFARGRLGGGISVQLDDNARLQPVLEHLVEETRASSPSRTIESEIAITDSVTCDPLRLAQLVSNLLANAVTHGSTDTPIRLRALTHEGMLEVSVSNSGDAIPPAAMAQLFQPFVRGQVRESQQGLGLGLYIASQIAKAHGGTLSVDSTDAETRFTFRMPLEPPQATP